MIAEGSSKLASVPSGGSGGGAAAAPSAPGAAAAEEKAEEKKEEGMHRLILVVNAVANILCRQGRVRRRYGLRSFRLRNQPTLWKRCSGLLVYRQSFWKVLCGLDLFLHAMGVKGRFLRSSREGIHPWTLDSQYRQYRRASFGFCVRVIVKLEDQCCQ